MKCPKCGHQMDLKNFGADYSLARCSHCHGIWFNAATLADLAHVPMLDVLDTGDAARGAVYNQIVEIDCPECGIQMEGQSVPRQPHIRVEVCSTCTGVFLDAGELRDAKHYTLGDWLKAVKIRFSID